MDRDCLLTKLLLCRAGLAVAAFSSALLVRADFQGSTHLMPFEEDTIKYNETVARDAVAILQKRIETGAVTLKRDADRGWFPALLKELNVPASSQMLVFSKTSLQRERISPHTPRAIYFNDDVYIGFIPGAPLIEISAVDPKLGGVFYTLDQTVTDKPKFSRNNQCLECHASAKTMGVPGHLVRSFATDEKGIADISSGTSQVNHRTPLEERWGGWYVTGTHGSQAHRGNLIGKDDFDRHSKDPSFGGNITNLTSFFDVNPYVRPGSDIVALMVLEHQTHMHNFITRLSYEATIALQQYGHVRYLKSATEGFLKYLLFVEETPLTAALAGNDDFVRDFSAGAQRDSKGRSLRDFDLKSRLFRFPCSYLIYSDAFEALPGPLKESLYQRLFDILTGKDTNPAYAKFDSTTRRAILEILRETKKDLPAYWSGETPGK